MTVTTPIGYDIEGHPIWSMFGAEDADDQDGTDEAEGDDETDGTDDGEGEEETVETLKERLGRVEAALRKANKEAERLRHKDKGRKPAAKKQAQDTSETEQWRARALRSDAKAALLGAGFAGDAKAAARLIKTIDTDELEFDGDEILGLDEQIDSLKEDFPGLFKAEEDEEQTPKTPARRRPKLPVADKGGKQTGRKKTPAEIQAEMLFGGQ